MYLNLKDFQIKTDVLQTAEIQKVFDEASHQNGATVIFPRGTYITGTINVGSASVYLEKGAIWKASDNFEDFRHNGFRHNEMRETISLFYSMGEDDIVIDGDGTIDLNARAFYHMDEPDIPIDGHIYSKEQQAQCTRKYEHRLSQPIFFYQCNHICVRNVKIVNAPCWTISFHDCTDVRFQDVTVINDLTIPNSDGVHFCGCRDVYVRGCKFTTGDDCIALSGISNWEIPCENVIISDCLMRSTSKALSIGYMHSIVRNVTITNCVILDSQRGIAFMASRGTGLVEHVLIENVRITTKVCAGNWWGNGEPICMIGGFHHYDAYLDPIPVRGYKVSIQDVTIRNISCAGENIIGILGEADDIADIRISDLYYETLPSKNRYLKGDRVLDNSPCAHQVQVPEAFEGCIYTEGCQKIILNNIIVKK